jgi:hypothetical protein
MQPSLSRAQTFRLLLAMNVLASIAHYADNIVRFVSYPEPPWINPTRIDLFWFVMTPVGVAAYSAYRLGRPRLAFALNAAYGAMNLFVLGHYAIAPPWRLPLAINALILLEALAAILLLGYTAHCALRERPSLSNAR